jgi:putative ABC transport system ATP-binding protein
MAWWSRKDRPAEGGDQAASVPFDPVIRLEGVTKVYKGDADEETFALRDVSLEIRRGEYISIAGPSGCGKSTLLSVLALLDAPTAGRYWLNGKATDQMSPQERARARSLEIGLIFQSFNLIGDMTVFENVEYPLTLRRSSPAERKAVVEGALERVGMLARAKQRPGSLAGGHQQLVAIARAIAGRPAVLLADEPTGNLDTASGRQILDLLDRMNEEGITLIVVTHDPNVARRADRIIVLVDGRVVRRVQGSEVGSVADLFEATA